MQTLSPELALATDQLRNGRMVILVDDEDRENEGDLVLAAEFATSDAINFMAKNARGLICLSMSPERIDDLQLPPMVSQNATARKTAFTISIEARSGVSTGISAADRAHTIRTAIDPTKGHRDLISPGHIFPLRAQSGGVLVRTGHTEGSIDLARLAGLRPAAVICEIMNEDGTMARLADLKRFSELYGIPIVSIQEIVNHRMQSECLIEEVAQTTLPSHFSLDSPFRVHAFRSRIDGSEHLALATAELGPGALVRVHSECLTGDVFGSLRCDCGEQLRLSMQQIAKSKNGALIYMRNQEGRGIGLANKMKAYALQDRGLDTVEANQHLGFGADLRHYGIGAQIIRALGLRKIKLLTNNPKKIVGLDGYGIEITERVPLRSSVHAANERYLRTKVEKLEHTQFFDQPEASSS